MQIVLAIVLGIIQGLTEFIPISSSGHLILADRLLGDISSLTFDLALHVGTLAALIWFFWRDLAALAQSLVKKTPQTRLAWYIVLATIPAVVVGIWLEDVAESVFRSTTLVAINLIWVALLMLIVDRLAHRRRKLTQMTAGSSLLVGLAQAVALIPGVSRSGITITAGLAQGFDNLASTRFSFLLAVPVTAGAAAKVLLRADSLQQIGTSPVAFLAGGVAAMVSGYLAIKFLLNYLSKHGLSLFAYYRIVLGLAVLILA